MEFTNKQKQVIHQVAETYDLRFVILHGSYATGKSRPGSDLDIAILGTQGVSAQSMQKIHETFGEIFGDNVKRELDIKSLHHVDSLFRYLVVQHGKLLYGDALAYEEFKAYAYRSYMDSADLRVLEETLVRKNIQQLDQQYA